MAGFIIKLLRLGFLAVAFLVMALFLYVPYNIRETKENNQQEVKKPNVILEFSGEEKTDFRWNYNGANYSVNVSLYRSAYDFYREKPKVFQYEPEKLPPDWKENYYAMFLAPAENDKTFEKIASDIKAIGQGKKLSGDQIAELALAFVQSLPYDEEKARLILSAPENSASPQTFPKYPYETLYEKKGVCSDKSFLAYILLENLGYGVSLFEFPGVNHMAIGIECPARYSTADSGYCYSETTNIGHRIGIIPELDENRKAIAKKELNYFGENGSASSGTSLENPQIFEKTEGKSYELITATFQTQQDLAKTEKLLASLRAQLTGLKNQIDSTEKELENLNDKMSRYKKAGQHEKYNSLVDDYNNLVKSYKKLVDQYNSKVNEYNRNVNYYNKLIKDFSILE